MLTLMTRYGIGLEGHLQNCVLVFRNGVPTRILGRDMGGVRILWHGFERHGLQVRFLPGSATLELDEDDLRHKVGYASFQNHWGELIACSVRTFDVDERYCWRPLYQTIYQYMAVRLTVVPGSRRRQAIRQQTGPRRGLRESPFRQDLPRRTGPNLVTRPYLLRDRSYRRTIHKGEGSNMR